MGPLREAGGEGANARPPNKDREYPIPNTQYPMSKSEGLPVWQICRTWEVDIDMHLHL
jgi:hypothetical protein